jgi:hypothetical protein
MTEPLVQAAIYPSFRTTGQKPGAYEKHRMLADKRPVTKFDWERHAAHIVYSNPAGTGHATQALYYGNETGKCTICARQTKPLALMATAPATHDIDRFIAEEIKDDISGGSTHRP